MHFRVLGQIEIHHGGRIVPAGTAMESSVLAVLLIEAGRVVSAQSLAERLWGDELPATAKGTLQAYISRLRTRLRSAGDEVGLIKRGGMNGYRLDTAPETVDAHRFQALVSSARAAVSERQPLKALGLLRDAEALWSGEALEGIVGQWAQMARAGLTEKLRAVRLARIELEMQVGESGQEAVGELVELAGADPFDQRAAGLLMRSLDLVGRSAEALEVYRGVATRLRRDLGIDPRPELQRLHLKMLRGGHESPRATSPATVGAAHTLDRDPPHWTGREDLVEQLISDVRDDLRTRSGIAVYGLDGMPGVGKTALAVRVGYRLVELFPDGVLQVNLRAHDPRHPAVDISAALTSLLDAVGADARQVDRAGSVDALAGLWRRHTRGRRLLVLLDDVTGFDDISLLVPAGPESSVLLTSRRRLSELPDARQYTLEPLADHDALRLFERISGIRAGADQASAEQVARACGGVPLAVAVSAAYLRTRPAWTWVDLAGRLASVKRPAPDDRVTGPVDIAVSMSYRDLSPVHRTLLRCVAALPGGHFGLHAAAAAMGWDSGKVDQELDVLVEQHLLQEVERHHYRLHDLVRGYALGLGGSDPDVASAVERCISYYIATAARAECVLRPYRRAAQRGSDPRWSDPHFPGGDAADAWLLAEHSTLRWIATGMRESVSLEARVCLVGVMAKFLDRRGLWREAAALLRGAYEEAGTASGVLSGGVQAELELDAAGAYIRTGEFEQGLALAESALARFTAQNDVRGMADSLLEIGRIHRHSARLVDAFGALRDSADLFGEIGDVRGRVGADLQRSVVLYRLDRPGEALELAELCKAEATALGDDALLSDALVDLGEMHRLDGEIPAALAYFTDARDLAQRVGDPHNVGLLALNIGLIHRDTELWQVALDDLTEARSIFLQIEDEYDEAVTLLALAELHRRCARFEAAAECIEAAQRLAERLNRPAVRLDVEIARAQLLLDQLRPAEAARTVREVLQQPETSAFVAQRKQAEAVLADALAALPGASTTDQAASTVQAVCKNTGHNPGDHDRRPASGPGGGRSVE